MATYPEKRLRRLRYNPTVRDMIRETVLTKNDLIYPLFAVPGKGIKNEVKSMPGVYQMSIDVLVEECKEVEKLGIPAVILFGIPEHKDEVGSGAYDANGIIQQAVRAIKKETKKLVVITDVCLCEYTSHGHCGVLDGERILNDETVDLLVKEAISHAEAGADIIAPSDMMDGRIGAIRKALDEKGFYEIPVMSYAVKYASGYYGPFRDAAESTPAFGDRRSHQMDIANTNEALREAESDIEEGADIIMVKPAGAYLDIIWRVKEKFQMPTAAYQVSGEYAMIKAAGRNNWIDEQRVMLESLMAIKRAGADMILTYFAKEVAKYLDANK
ncbi:MAG: delta-aminolevulinic acid dehydratase [Stygiobacter sp. RIFOXYC12_FULL_38_8]|nr:MAG: delta-aminolevulinic acid dehydratase [Stygiobacter sp. GWC2_38_9]OGV07285.1 MAG: delta-aminolevulinic acid dehydratase [Stygiobacter sp. RIFOXYB2_FULL_37_11]OGV10980.1 MAG: delta-aminolevulinic acid dehydratase [Stygiobacter sp. RIFOXYA2_FULL_38_8]OGV15814.1 MAG: delta-aminolevulinic acid dehydratase [Stygiobacter sp. RIFOXYC2_FULL_38_25]OGV29219.1 MAG: delta-aminolevulinic acid dehydratase [Stygiobacter sp. RIFOXYC12_FULL_38_8]OGV80928.1 MAG: delta-aminolevulinic acid dehydratase [St